MNYAYDYEELIDEIQSDLSEELINLSDTIKIVRSSRIVYENYRPIIDYYYGHYQTKEKYELMTVKDVLNEMKFHDKIIK